MRKKTLVLSCFCVQNILMIIILKQINVKKYDINLRRTRKNVSKGVTYISHPKRKFWKELTPWDIWYGFWRTKNCIAFTTTKWRHLLPKKLFMNDVTYVWFQFSSVFVNFSRRLYIHDNKKKKATQFLCDKEIQIFTQEFTHMMVILQFFVWNYFWNEKRNLEGDEDIRQHTSRQLPLYVHVPCTSTCVCRLWSAF